MSVAQKLRDQLAKTPEASNEKLAKLCGANVRQVYQVRYELKKKQTKKKTVAKVKEANTIAAKAWKTRQKNEKSLSAVLIEILTANPQGLNAKQITSAVKKAGYKSSSKAFPNLVKQTLYIFSKRGNLDRIEAKGGSRYVLKASEVPSQLFPKETVAPSIHLVDDKPSASNGIPDDILSATILNDLAKLTKRAGGVTSIQKYLGTLQELQN